MYQWIVVGILLSVVGHHEYVRFQHNLSECHLQRNADSELLMRDVCFNHEDRILFRDSVNCDGAERRLRVSPWSCALQEWFLKSNLTEMFREMTGSYWRLLLVVMLPLLFSMWLWKSHRTEMAVVEKMGKLMGKLKNGKIKGKNKLGTAVCYR